MQYLIIILLCMMATAKMCLQSGFGKEKVKNTADTMVFNGFVFFFSALIFSYRLIGCSPIVWAYASVTAVFSALFQMFYMKALSIGNVSLTVLITNFSMVINVLFSYLWYQEPISKLRLVGILMTLAAFVICTDFKSGKSMEKRWLLFAVCSLFMTSGISVSQKIFAESAYQAESQAFVSCHYAVAAVLTLVFYLFLKQKGEGKTFPIDRKTILTTLATGTILSVYQALYTHSVSVIDGTFFYPATTGGIVVFSTLSGVVLFRDKLNCKQIISIVLGIAAVVLMSF